MRVNIYTCDGPGWHRPALVGLVIALVCLVPLHCSHKEDPQPSDAKGVTLPVLDSLFTAGGEKDEMLVDVVVDPMGGTYIAGVTTSQVLHAGDLEIVTGHDRPHDESIFIMKLDAKSEIQWLHVFGHGPESLVPIVEGMRTGYTGMPVRLAMFPDGDLLVSGVFSSLDLDLGRVVLENRTDVARWGMSEIYLARFSPDGTLRWAKVIGSEGADTYVQTRVDHEGDIIVASAFDAALPSYDWDRPVEDDTSLTKLDGSGNVLWEKRIPGNDVVHPLTITVGNENEIVLCGEFVGESLELEGIHLEGSSEPDLDDPDIFIARFDAVGKVEAARRVGKGYRLLCQELHPMPGGGYYLIGSFRGGVAHVEGTRLQIGECEDVARGLKRICLKHDQFIVRYDESLTPLWVKHVGAGHTEENPVKAAVGDDGSLYLAMSMDEGQVVLDDWILGPAMDGDIGLARLTASGHTIWATTIGGSGSDGILAMNLGNPGEIYLAGFLGSPTLPSTGRSLSLHGGLDAALLVLQEGRNIPQADSTLPDHPPPASPDPASALHSDDDLNMLMEAIPEGWSATIDGDLLHLQRKETVKVVLFNRTSTSSSQKKPWMSTTASRHC